MVSGVRAPFTAAFLLVASSALAAPVCPAPKAMTFQFDHEIHRDMTGFTEGLEVHDHNLFESTGALGGGTRTMRNPRDGWGMTNDGRYLIFGDGGDKLFFAQPDGFAIKGSITVKRGADTVNNVNELEYVAGKIYANIWMTRSIVRIDARTGCIEAEADMSPLWTRMTEKERETISSDDDSVLNGIAYDPASQLFTVTGKQWPMLFSGRFQDR
jgi:glutamine cyclotransferase